jgi:light-harvesting complex I chlorophyll a/b binding protein 1
MSKSLPFLPCPEKLDGSMAGDVGFDPMGLSEIQQDLIYARWAELKHGRIAMLAIVGLLVQEYIHLPGEAYQNSDPFGAISTVGLGVNAQIFMGIGVVELANFYKHYDGSEPGDINFTGGFLKNKSEADIKKLKEQEIKHCRLAMVAITGATVQTLMFHQPLLG